MFQFLAHYEQQNYSIMPGSIDQADSSKKRVGNYSFHSKDVIGKGYSSTVYRGVNDTSGQSIALKLIDTKNMKGEIHKTLLHNEIDILKRLNNIHHVIKVHDILPMKHQTCIVTEHCQGGDLAKVIKMRKLIPQAEATDILKQVIDGYKGLWRQGVIHRDLKPANIFFTQGSVKIADFGFAIKTSDLKASSSYNVGSPVYMPLEALNSNQYSAKSDVWAIGVIFYEMLTGKTPWRAKTEADLKRQIQTKPVKSVIPAHVSRNASQFITRSLHLNPSLRMTADEMITYFEEGMEQSQHYTPPINQRTNSLFRTRVASQDRGQRNERPDILPLGKNIVTAPKSFRKSTRHGQLFSTGQIGKVNAIKDIKGRDDHLVLQKIQREPKLGSLARTVAGMSEWMPDSKNTSNQLLSQIHFCRFCFKLLQRMQQKGLGSQEMRELLASILGGKMNELKELSLIKGKYAALFKRTKEYEKISEILGQYSLKYAQVSRWQGQDYYHSVLKQADQLLTHEIKTLHSEIGQGRLEGKEEEVILLDYLITLKQLLLLNSREDMEYFHQKSKIDVIVEGRPSKNITPDHLQAITHKLRLFKIIA